VTSESPLSQTVELVSPAAWRRPERANDVSPASAQDVLHSPQDVLPISGVSNEAEYVPATPRVRLPGHSPLTYHPLSAPSQLASPLAYAAAVPQPSLQQTLPIMELPPQVTSVPFSTSSPGAPRTGSTELAANSSDGFQPRGTAR
jgi:hypothetical protein